MFRVLNMSVLLTVLQKTAHHIPWVLNMLGLEYTRAVNLSKLHRVLCKLYFKDLRCLACLEFSILKVLNVSGV